MFLESIKYLRVYEDFTDQPLLLVFALGTAKYTCSCACTETHSNGDNVITDTCTAVAYNIRTTS